MTQLTKSIGIVGCGPKGLYALDSLCEAARGIPAQQFDVHIFEPFAHPGAGPIYNPDQSDVLLMNFPAHMIDAWTERRGPNLRSWLKCAGTPVTAGTYVPRACVGEYLHHCFEVVLSSAPSNIRITVYPVKISALRPEGGSWLLEPGDISVDEVLVTTGHQDWTRRTQKVQTEAIASPFPVTCALTTDAVPPSTSVACKGFALTFIDTMLALTEGRGGVFTQSAQGYDYQPSGAEPKWIAPYSRSARPMRAKVDSDRFVPPQSELFWQDHICIFETEISERSDVSFINTVWPALQHIADAVLQRPQGSTRTCFDEWRGEVFSAERCRAELSKGYEIAIGVTAPDSLWALAEAWRRCYPALVAWISHQELLSKDAAHFRESAAEMERLAFGPPAQNVGKLLCLERMGLVSIDHLSGDHRCDVTINATIPATGSAELSKPLAGLLHDGHVSVGSLGGLRVDNDAQALTKGGVTSGLSIIGRATEGSVLGNDTLSRNLHDLPERWASRVTKAGRVFVPERVELPA
ncbi:FAD/NAD(P)-binding protein [Sedimentitalea todarodis]|uniref:FAD/NAD(P)-binding protein n=1 Tax=Sedimentitalea todarodis TaxID=1631240 RepID=A0ABU3VKR7_9RHOB|nr:FAD/NAD(P)-binding protein [Sedimentitalea todarodis]MDU9006784.1 FAD/NAD(P)-binding protein [Sedimentitalea todarodis]